MRRTDWLSVSDAQNVEPLRIAIGKLRAAEKLLAVRELMRVETDPGICGGRTPNYFVPHMYALGCEEYRLSAVARKALNPDAKVFRLER